jgi:methionine synthase II (cobalamin-independent)
MVFIIPSDVPQVLPAYEQAMIREVEKICAAIPHADLALQWDVCMEMIQWDGRAPGMAPFPGMERAFAGAFARICAPVPADVELGIHLCYGDMDAKHFIQPQDLGKAVELANLISASVSHPLAWIHMPVPADRADRAYYEPLRKLQRGARTELYLGLVHTDDGVAGTVQRMRAAHEFVSDFGIATECGISRARTPEKVRALLQLHAAAARAYAGAS